MNETLKPFKIKDGEVYFNDIPLGETIEEGLTQNHVDLFNHAFHLGYNQSSRDSIYNIIKNHE